MNRHDAERERIAREIAEFQARGGVIQKLEQHEVSGTQLDDFTSRIMQADKVPPRNHRDFQSWRERK